MDVIIAILPLVVGWTLDFILGDPAWLPHPVVGFGKLISFFEHRLNHGRYRVAKGAFTAIGLILSAYFLTLFVINQLDPYPWIKCGLESILIFYCLAATTLVREVRMVFSAVERSLEEGRRQVARIVGRDTASLSAQEIRTAALETLAENLSDGVIAPLFWYMLLGVPGMVAYKMINTLDSMTGYRNARFCEYGRWAAKIDDIANYLPARITSFLMIMASCRISLLSFVTRYGRCHASPNSGYPEAALAGILDCRFGGPHDYFGECVDKPYIGDNPRPLTTADMSTAIRINRIAELLMLIIVIATRL